MTDVNLQNNIRWKIVIPSGNISSKKSEIEHSPANMYGIGWSFTIWILDIYDMISEDIENHMCKIT